MYECCFQHFRPHLNKKVSNSMTREICTHFEFHNKEKINLTTLLQNKHANTNDNVMMYLGYPA